MMTKLLHARADGAAIKQEETTEMRADFVSMLCLHGHGWQEDAKRKKESIGLAAEISKR